MMRLQNSTMLLSVAVVLMVLIFFPQWNGRMRENKSETDAMNHDEQMSNAHERQIVTAARKAVNSRESWKEMDIRVEDIADSEGHFRVVVSYLPRTPGSQVFLKFSQNLELISYQRGK